MIDCLIKEDPYEKKTSEQNPKKGSAKRSKAKEINLINATQTAFHQAQGLLK